MPAPIVLAPLSERPTESAAPVRRESAPPAETHQMSAMMA